ncbi:hypothetical protein Tco_0950019 [Tanacetum coccineum]
MTLAFIAARPPCFDLSSFVKKIALLSQFEHEKIARYYGADKVAIEYRSITHGVGIILKEKRPSVRGKDHFVDEQKYPCVNPHYHTIRCEEKESTLAYYHRIHGNKWAEIAKHLPGSWYSVGKNVISPLVFLFIFESRLKLNSEIDIMDMINNQDIEHMIPPTPPPDYPFDESIFAELDNSLWIILRPLKSKPIPEEPNESDAC